MATPDAFGPEISDVIVDFDPVTLERRPVAKRDVVERFAGAGNARAVRVVESIRDVGGVLDPAAVDELLIAAHREIQRLSEEFEHGQRVLEMLAPLLRVIRATGAAPPHRFVDVGCGTGFVLRWLAANAGWDDVDWVGADYNRALVEEARRLSSIEQLSCRFVVANAFELAEPATVYFSTGVIHHFRGEYLERFFAQHDQPHALGFLHFDFQPSALTPIGAWLFHVIRMRLPLSMHDGVLSAIRSHSGATLLGAARKSASGFASSLYSQRFGPFPRPFHAIYGVRPHLRPPLVAALGARASRLAGFEAAP
jgi:SAM-dependent methyltransferase